MKDTATVRDKNRRIRQDAEREALANKGLIQHVLEIAKELNDDDNVLDSLMIQRKKIVIDTQLKLIDKYLPGLKQQEIDLNHGVQDSLTELLERINEFGPETDED